MTKPFTFVTIGVFFDKKNKVEGTSKNLVLRKRAFEESMGYEVDDAEKVGFSRCPRVLVHLFFERLTGIHVANHVRNYLAASIRSSRFQVACVNLFLELM